jgi:cell division protein FtsB
MKRDRQNKERTSAKIFSGIFFLAGLLILILIGISLGKETYRKRQIQKEIEGLEEQINQLGQENNDMNNLISYLQSNDFTEKEAREKLNLQKNDEKMIILQKEIVPQGSSEASGADSTPTPVMDGSPNWQKWWKHFFQP